MVKKSASATDEVHWLNLRYTETQCPGLHQALESAPNDQLSALARGIIYQWFLHHQQAGTLTKAVVATLAGPGATGQRSLRRSSRPRKTLRAWHRWRLCRQTIARRWRASRRRPSLKIRCPLGLPAPPRHRHPCVRFRDFSSPPASAPALPQISMEQPLNNGENTGHDKDESVDEAPDALFTFFN
jgi:hypothetical protein